MTLLTVDMEAGFCQFDRIEIADGGRLYESLDVQFLCFKLPLFPLKVDVGSRRLGRYCRRDHQGVVVTSTSNTAKISFFTDASINRTGFQITARPGNDKRTELSSLMPLRVGNLRSFFYLF